MYMNVKEGQLSEHGCLDQAVAEAQRLANKLDCRIFTIEAISCTTPSMPRNNGKPWTRALDSEMLFLFMSGNHTPRDLARHFGRTAWALICRLEKYRLKCSEDCTYRGW